MSEAGRALIKVGYACNNGCVFCHSHGSAPPRSSGEEVEAKIRAAADLGCGMVVFSGGEPTMRPELPAWARLARELDLPLGLVTNGRMLSYAPLLEELRKNGLRYAQVSLHAGYEAVHDQITRAAGAFQQTVAALVQIHLMGVDLNVNVVVTRANLETLDQVPVLLGALEGARLKFSLVEPKGAALERFDELVPPPEEVGRRVRQAMAHAASVAPGLRLIHEGIPLCFLPGYEGGASGLVQDGFTHMSEAYEQGFFPVDADNRAHPEPCQGCGLRATCPGLYRAYLERRPLPPLRPRVSP